ncbi:MAG: hypothetical protein SVN78_05060 [Deferribacterota bacterium]|nr:hypothetical protein [Deferribacterota bacterium]
MNKKIISLFILIVILSGCIKITSEHPKVHYYIISFIPEKFEKKALPVKIDIEPFTISQIYNTDKFIYRTDEYEITKDFYNRWIIKPASFITEYIRDYISFNFIDVNKIKHYDKFKIRGHIYEFYAKIDKGRLEAAINLSVNLYWYNNIMKTYDLIYTKNYRESTSTKDISVKGYIKSMEKNISNVSKSILNDIYSYIQKKIT